GVEVGRLTIPTYPIDQPAASDAPPADVFLRAPYLMQPRVDGVTIGWLTPLAITSGSVRVGPSGQLGTSVASQTLEQADGMLHHVRLTGLTPGTPYDYEVTAGGRTV